MLGPATSVTQCTVFAYEFGNRPRTVSVADHRGERFCATSLFLARFALLAIERIGNAQTCLGLVDAAGENVSAAAPE